MLAWWLYGVRIAPSSVSASPRLLVVGTCPVVRNVRAAIGAAAPPTVRCWNVPWIGAIVGKSRCALGREPALDHCVALNSWPTLGIHHVIRDPVRQQIPV